jgi:uncharacterized membrane protein YphA (DoxX/SURF4 family)
MSLVRLIARPLLAAPLVARGSRIFLDPDPVVPAADPVAQKVAPAIHKVTTAVPTDTRTLVRMTSGLQIGAGAVLALGIAPRLAAATLAATTLPLAVVEHAFWSEQDKQAKREKRTAFLTDLGLVGGLLLASVDTEGKPGVPWRTRRAARDARRAARTARREARLAILTAKLEGRQAAAQARQKVAAVTPG